MILKRVLDVDSFEDWRKLKHVVGEPMLKYVTELLTVQWIDLRVIVAGPRATDQQMGLWYVDSQSQAWALRFPKSYMCAGSGSELSEAVMGMWGHTRETDRETSMRTIYEAIRITMASQGTAAGTVDMYTIDDSGAGQVEQREVGRLDDSFGPVRRLSTARAPEHPRSPTGDQ